MIFGEGAGGRKMKELNILFDEILTFEEEVNNKDPYNSTYPDKTKAERVFNEYVEWRLNQIIPKVEDPINWIH